MIFFLSHKIFQISININNIDTGAMEVGCITNFSSLQTECFMDFVLEQAWHTARKPNERATELW
jgi:hypothetical protein